MAFFIRWHLIAAFLQILNISNLASQDIINGADRAYGPDPLLYNGRKYSFYLPQGVDGNQYLFGEEFSPGNVIINGVNFKVDQLNYDIYNQKILLKYENEAGAMNVIELSLAWMEGFSLGKSHFELITIPGKERRIYQVLGSTELRIMVFRRKTLKLDMAYGSENYVFSPPEKEYYLQTGDNYQLYRNNKSFITAFNQDKQPDIRRYLKEHHINVKKATDSSLAMLLTFCENLLR